MNTNPFLASESEQSYLKKAVLKRQPMLNSIRLTVAGNLL
jgi:hypothetical protein